MELTKEIKEHRKPEHEITPLLLNRWSPRALSGELSDKEIMALFEAARWAPSSYNNQPWRFIYAKRNTPHWNKLFGLIPAEVIEEAANTLGQVLNPPPCVKPV